MAYQTLQQPVFVEQSALVVRALGGLPGGMSPHILTPLGLDNFCKILDVFDDRYAEAQSVIAFTDGKLRRKFVGILPGEIAPRPRGKGYDWDTIFIPQGFNQTNAEMGEEQFLSISMRRRAIVQFMQFLQSNYVFE
jgi:XTP/dITP diphosphohydrolase